MQKFLYGSCMFFFGFRTQTAGLILMKYGIQIFYNQD